jgi:hypothetical protein
VILFKPEHVPMILAGTKTQTRRLHRRPLNVGTVHKCYTKPPFARGGAEPFASVRVIRRRVENHDDLWEISDADVRAEGYETRHDYLAAFMRINRLDDFDELIGTPITVYDFELAHEGARQ